MNETPLDMPKRLLVDAAGFVWRDFGEGYLSGCPFNPDNEPLPEPVTAYVPLSDVETLVEEARDTLAAMEAERVDVLWANGELMMGVLRNALRPFAGDGNERAT